MTLVLSPIFLTCACGLAMLAGTVRSINQNLTRRKKPHSRSIVCVSLDLIEGTLWGGTAAAVFGAAPHPVTLVLITMFAVSIGGVIRLRYCEEVRSLNKWLPLTSEMAVSLPAFAANFADGCHSRLSRQARAFAFRLERGESVIKAAYKTKLPLDASVLAAITLPVPELSADPLAIRDESGNRSRYNESWESSTDTTHSWLRPQIAYVLATLYLAWGLGWLIRSNILPTFEQMFDEFGFSFEIGFDFLSQVAILGNVGMTLLTLWLALADLIAYLPLWLVRWVPWFGRLAIDRWRRDILQTLGHAMQAKKPAGEVFALCRVSRVRWVRVRCRQAREFSENGTALPRTLHQSKFISERESVWLASAEKNGDLTRAIRHLCDNIHRRQMLRWRLRMTWLVPLATLLVGGYVLIHAMVVFNYLFSFIRGMA